jgi:hypothetical protein
MISLSTLSVSPHRVGLRQLSSTPKLMMPPVIGKPLRTSNRIVTALVLSVRRKATEQRRLRVVCSR